MAEKKRVEDDRCLIVTKPIADLLSPKYKILEQVWGLIAVSLAAQIATAPLTMLYFHQFPAYFIPANLIAIPLSFLAIYSGVAVLVTSTIPLISNFLGLLTNYLLFALNYSVGFIEGLPYSVFKITNIFLPEMILLYLILISILLMFFLKRKALLYITLVLILVLSVSFSFTEINRQKQQKIVFYSTNKQSAIGFIMGVKQILLADSVLLKDETAIKFQLDGAKSLYGLTISQTFALDTITGYYQKLPKESSPLCSLGNYFLFNDKRIAVIEGLPKLSGECSKLRVDFLVVRKSPQLRIKDIQQLYQPGLIVIDGSNSFYKTEKWLTEFKKAGLKAYSVKKSGALVVGL